MAELHYTAITSLDGYMADTEGKFDWAFPTPEVHRFVNDLERPIGTFLFGRRMYEVMAFWEDPELAHDTDAEMRDYAGVWRQADKIVYSSSLESVSTERTTLERQFDPEAVRQMKATATRDISIGGPTLAAHALRAGLVDQLKILVNPVIVGGGTAALPGDLRLNLELVDERRFENGVVFMHYRVLN
jgi:dihydrofolate reductase